MTEFWSTSAAHGLHPSCRAAEVEWQLGSPCSYRVSSPKRSKWCAGATRRDLRHTPQLLWPHAACQVCPGPLWSACQDRTVFPQPCLSPCTLFSEEMRLQRQGRSHTTPRMDDTRRGRWYNLRGELWPREENPSVATGISLQEYLNFIQALLLKSSQTELQTLSLCFKNNPQGVK